jgi:hypothetical protein
MKPAITGNQNVTIRSNKIIIVTMVKFVPFCIVNPNNPVSVTIITLGMNDRTQII